MDKRRMVPDEDRGAGAAVIYAPRRTPVPPGSVSSGDDAGPGGRRAWHDWTAGSRS